MGEPRPRRATVTVGRAALLLLAAGCTTDWGSRDNRHDDPLLGGGARPAGQPVAVATATPTGTALGPPPPAYQPQPPLTQALPTSNAALASGGFQPLPGSSDLRIGTGSPTLGAPPGGVQLQQPTFTDPRAATPATPVSAPGAGVPSAVAPPTPMTTLPAAGPRGSLDQAYAAVAARNPLWHRMKFNGQTREYTFAISVPSRLNAAVARTAEGTAATQAEAIQRALEQLAGEQ
jgi:hypothetical protein